ncbi:MAG: choice-of-anchor J domain-containing protein, partial [Candidatus Syntrophosphaera sp.]
YETIPLTATHTIYNVNLGSYAGTDQYIAFKHGQTTTYDYAYLDDVVFDVIPANPIFSLTPDVTTWDFGQVVINMPATQEFTITNIGGGTLSLTSVATTGDYYSISVPPTDMDLAAGESTSFTVQFLPTVEGGPYTGTLDITDNRLVTTVTLTGSCNDPIISTFPWMEDFGVEVDPFPPLDWTEYNGLMVDPITLTPGSSYWYQDDFANIVLSPTNESARMNIYSTARKGWLLTPPIDMPGTGYQLEFDIALTDYANAAPPDDPAGYSGVDDKFAVLIGDGITWSTADAVKIWDNDAGTTGGIYEVYNDVSHTGDHIIIPLDGYTGIKYVAFYGESTISNADNDFFVDNVLIREIPAGAPDHVILTSPPDASTGIDPDNVVLEWSAATTGGIPDYYEVYVGADPIDPVLGYYGEYFYEVHTGTSLDLSAQGDITIGYDNTWYWAVLPYNTSGAPDPTDSAFMIWQFTTGPDPTIVALPYEQYFDAVTAPEMAWGWSSYVNSTSSSAVVVNYSSTTYSVTPPNVIRMYNSSDTEADLRLITPPIDASIPLNTIKLKFYARGSGTGDNVLIGTVNTPDGSGVFTQIDSLVLTTIQTEYTYSLDDYTGTDQYICFKLGTGETYNYAYIDNVQLLELLANDLAATAISGSGILEAGTSYDYIIDVYNEGTAAQSSYTVNLMEGTNVLATLNVTDPLDPGATAQHVLSWTPTTGGVYALYGQVVLAGDGNPANDETAPIDVYVIDSTMDLVEVGDDETTTSGYYLPLTMYYKNSVSEELYFTDELHMQSGTIGAIVYKNTFGSDLQDKSVKIWMAHTDSLDLTGGWLPETYTLVFDGTVDFPSGINYVVIPLDTPYNYTGGTLATRVNRPMDTQYYSSSDKFFYTTTPDHASRSRYLYSDSTEYDPLAPSGTGTAVDYVPNTTFVVENAVFDDQAELEGHVYVEGTMTPIEGATVTLSEGVSTT